MKVEVTKLTDVELLRRANSFTTGHESKMTLAKAYAYQHSPCRTQLFWIELTDIPLFVASQLVRSHVGVQFYQRSKRTDRGGVDFRDECEQLATDAGVIFPTEGYSFAEEYQHRATNADSIRLLPRQFDRLAPTDLAFICNAEAIMNMSHKRLCAKASSETREVWQEVVSKIREIDPDLAKHCVPQCMYRGGICPEPKGCGYNKTELFNKQLTEYKKLFV